MFFGGWWSLARVLIVGSLAYVSLIIVLRATGKRTLSKMNAFDFVVTVALGSTLATVLLNAQVSLAEGVLALALLTGLQFLITWLSVRRPPVKRWITAEPRMLAWRGTLLRDAMRRERVLTEEVLSALRQAGLGGLADAEAVILETDGTLSVVPRSGRADGAALRDIPVTPEIRSSGQA